MPSIDKRVVEMKFNREDFKQGVADVLNGLQSMEDRLGSGGIASNVEKIAGRFSAIGVVGATALGKLTSSAMTAGKAIVDKVMVPLFEGGTKRALNIEQARFQFEGLGMDVEASMDSALAAVKNTAFGLDEAAVVAAQFGASGMKAGEDMAKSLRGISGVAAMAGSSYSDIGSIFTKVAGQGRLMGDDLNRLATRGINAAATLADSMGTTEEAVRKMVTKGEIDFETFAFAMEDAFGEHATKANETYTGSLSNMNAAISRIGAGFATVKHEKQRKMFNALTPVIDKVAGALQPVVELYSYLSDKKAASFERFMGFLDNKVPWESITGIIKNLTRTYINFQNSVKTYTGPIVAAFKNVFSTSKEGGGFFSFLERMTKNLSKWAKGLGLNRANQLKFQESMEKFFTWIKSAGAPLQTAIGWFKSLGDHVKAAGDWISKTIPEIGDAVKAFGSSIEAAGGGVAGFFKSASQIVTGKVKELAQWFMDLYVAIRDGEGVWAGLHEGIDKAFKSYDDFAKWISNVGATIFEVLTSGWDKVTEAFDKAGNKVEGGVSKFQKFMDWIRPALDGVSNAVGGALTAIGNFFAESDPVVLLMGLQSVLQNIIALKLGSGFAKMASGIGDGLKTAGEGIGGFFTSISQPVEESNPAKILKVAGAIGILAASLWVMAQIPREDLIQSGIALGGIVAILTGTLGAITKIMDGKTIAKLPSTAFALTLFAVAVSVMAGALKKLEGIEAGDLAMSVAAVAALSIVMVELSDKMSNIKPGAVLASAASMVIMSGALYAMAGVVAIFGAMPLDMLFQGMIGVVAMMGTLVAAAMILGNYTEDMLLSAIGLVAMAAAINMLVIPITAIGLLPLDVLEQGLIGLGIALGGMVLAAVIMSEFAEDLLLGAVGLVAMSFALGLLVPSITAMGLLPMEVMAQGLIGLGIALLALAGAAMLMDGMVMGAAGVLALAAAMMILAIAIKTMSEVDTEAAAWGVIIMAGALAALIVAATLAVAVSPGLIALGIALAGFGIAAIGLAMALSIGAGALALFGNALTPLADGLVYFGSKVQEMGLAIPILMLLGIAMIPLAAVTVALGVGMMLLGAGIAVLSAGLLVLATTGPQGTLALVAFVKALTPMLLQIPKLGLLSAAFLAMGIATLALGVGLLAVGVGAIAAALGLAALAGAGALASLAGESIKRAFTGMEPAIANMNNLGSALVSLGSALIQVAGSFAVLLASLSQVMNMFNLSTIAVLLLSAAATSVAGVVSTSFMTMALGAAVAAAMLQAAALEIIASVMNLQTSVSGAAPAAGAAVSVMIMLMVNALRTGRGQIVDAIATIVLAFTLMNTQISNVGGPAATTVRVMIQKIVQELGKGQTQIPVSIGKIVLAFLGLSKGIDQNRTKSVTSVKTMMTSVRTALNNSKGSLSSSAYSVGVAITSGMSRGIRNNGGSVSSAARTVALNALSSSKRALGVASPSKEFFWIGEMMILGLVSSLLEGSHNVEDASESVANASMDTIRETFDEMVSEMGDLSDLGFNPTIRPVLDLNDVRNQASGLNDMFGVQGVDAQFSRGQAGELAVLEEVLRNAFESTEESQPKEINYVQNNYSPKALSSAEIYRQTKNQISTVSRRKD